MLPAARQALPGRLRHHPDDERADGNGREWADDDGGTVFDSGRMQMKQSFALVLAICTLTASVAPAFGLGPDVTYRDEFVPAETLGEFRANSIRALDTLLAMRQGSRYRSEVEPRDITQLHRTLGYYEAALDAYEVKYGRARVARCELNGTAGAYGRVSILVGALMRGASKEPYATATGKLDAAVNAVALFCGS